MASGPPPSTAESSKTAGTGAKAPQQPVHSSTPTPRLHTTQAPNPYALLATPVTQQSYQAYWQHAWPMYSGGASAVSPTGQFSPSPYTQHHVHYYPTPVQATTATSNAVTRVASNSPALPTPVVKMDFDEKSSSAPPSVQAPPPKYDHWDEAIRVFLQDAGLIQALRGFEVDMVVMNTEWERTAVALALERLIKGLSGTRELMSPKGKGKEVAPDDHSPTQAEVGRSLDDRKLTYIKLANGEKACGPTSINKEISAFLAKSRARNDSSNRSEFLLSLAEKRKRLQEEEEEIEDGVIPSCARTDARTVDREAQMKYDIAKNDDGPLRRTKVKTVENQQSAPQPSDTIRPAGEVVLPNDENALPEQHPGADERLSNIEAHLAVRYVPSSPRTLWSRLKFLEDHIIRLEKDYPPWAALHFNQPNRGWPPPPRTTPIIVPPHLRYSKMDGSSSSAKTGGTSGSQPSQQGSVEMPSVTSNPGSKSRNTKSSLQLAIMEKLEVKQAMGEHSKPGG